MFVLTLSMDNGYWTNNERFGINNYRMIHANEIAERRLNVVEKVGSFLMVYLTIATASILGLVIYAFL